ncbi:proline-rich protein 19 [Fundulus diaphanus]
MSHACGEKNCLPNKQSKAADKRSCCATKLNRDSKYFNHNKDEEHKIRRLKTRKERCQMRAGRTDALKNKSHHRHHFCQSRKDLTYFPNCWRSCHLPTRKNTPISSAVPVTQGPSMITEGRLIGHHGLFNHEVKSVNIERLFGEQSKPGQSEQKTSEENNNSSHLPSTPCTSVLLSGDGLLDAEGEGVPVKKKVNANTKTLDDSQEMEMTNLQASNQGDNITPDLQQQLHSSCESLKSINQSKNSFQAIETESTENRMSGTDEAPQPKPFADRGKMKTLNRDMISDQQEPYKNQESPALADDPISCQFQQFTSLSDSDQEPDHVPKTIRAVAARLCECLHLPDPNGRNLLSETREVLLKSLQKKHGPCLQSNLQDVQRSLRFPVEPAQATMEEEHVMVEDELLSTDTSVKATGSEHFRWKSSPQPNHNLQQITGELANPEDTFVNLLDDPFRSNFSPHHFMDFELSGTSVSDLFAQSPILSQGKNVSRPDLWKDYRFHTRETVLLDSFQHNLMNHSGDMRERISEQRPHHRNVEPFFPYQDGHSADLHHFPQELNPCETDRFYVAPIFPSKSHCHPQGNHLKAFGQPLPVHPDFRSNPTDMMHYPPSYMLERSLTPPSSSLPSPERWSFPPMRLY